MLKDDDRFRLLNGPYKAPQFAPGEYVLCVRCGFRVKVGDYTEGPIPWPTRWGTDRLILCGDLVRAVPLESEIGVAHHWGVSIYEVYRWRKALGVPRDTGGTMRLYDLGALERSTPEFMRRMIELARLPAARAKISAAAKLRPMDPRVRAIFLAHSKLPKSEATRQKMSASSMERILNGKSAILSPEDVWKPEEVVLLGSQSDAEIAKRLGRSRVAVQLKRRRLGIPAKPDAGLWTPEQISLLGTRPDAEVAFTLGRTLRGVQSKRESLARPPSDYVLRPWTAEETRLLGSKPDEEVAQLLGRTCRAVRSKRVSLGLVKRQTTPWTPDELKLLGNVPDDEIARASGRSLVAVQVRRRYAGIPNPIPAPPSKPWTPEDDKLLGTMRDEELAAKLGRPPSALKNRRFRLGIPCPASERREWSEEEIQWLKTKPDRETARLSERTLVAVKVKRIKLHIPVNREVRGRV